MKILKYKKMSNGRYKVSLENMDLLLYEEVILKYNLLITKEIDPLMIEDISQDNMFYEVYYYALNSLKSRFKSVYDIRKILEKKEFPNQIIDNVIDKLLSQGYLNDESFVKAFINNKLMTTNYGPYKLKSELVEHKVDIDLIEKELSNFSYEDQLVKIEKLVNRFYKSNHTRGGIVLRNKIANDIINYGYEFSLIDKVLDKFDFSDNEEIAKAEYKKLYNKLSRKYSNEELERKIREKMYMKGLKYEKD